ncbi:MAG: hypothetical protein ACK5Y6_07905 [Pseudomonadota bacterium]|jgi:hypothetical protein
MRTVTSILLTVVFTLTSASHALAEYNEQKRQAIRIARRIARTEPTPDVVSMANTNFDGVWAGRYVFSSRVSTCTPRLQSFNFQHVFITRGGRGILSTNHDGDFTGRSRDKGRKWEFSKNITVAGRPAVLAVIYQNLARNGSSAATAIGIQFVGGCSIAYGAAAVRVVK